ncbi:MAG: DUF3010 family protein [Marinagarivorans sp.]|nr:DUF3010 family protein [Marinagarivorans sp.]
MIVCGVELKSNEAIVCLMTLTDGLFSLPDCRASRIPLPNLENTESIRAFQSTFSKLMEDYKVEKIVIRERLQKGKFAGGALGFKMEAAIQLIARLKIEVLAPSAIKAAIAAHSVPVRFEETGLKPFQEVAFITAYASFAQGFKI